MIYIKSKKSIVDLLFVLKIENVMYVHFKKNVVNV